MIVEDMIVEDGTRDLGGGEGGGRGIPPSASATFYNSSSQNSFVSHNHTDCVHRLCAGVLQSG